MDWISVVRRPSGKRKETKLFIPCYCCVSVGGWIRREYVFYQIPRSTRPMVIGEAFTVTKSSTGVDGNPEIAFICLKRMAGVEDLNLRPLGPSHVFATPNDVFESD